jgi:hypothetical protein
MELVQKAIRIFLIRKMQIGDHSYIRHIFLQNLLATTSKHEEFLDDIYRVVIYIYAARGDDVICRLKISSIALIKLD